MKLALQSRISMQNICNGEFIVLVPLTKNASNQTRNSNQSKTSELTNNANLILKFADLARNEMMQDFSSLRDTAKTEDQNTETGNSREEEIAGTSCSGFSQAKRKRGNDFVDSSASVSWNGKARKSCASSILHSGPKQCGVGLNFQLSKLVLL